MSKEKQRKLLLRQKKLYSAFASKNVDADYRELLAAVRTAKTKKHQPMDIVSKRQYER